MKDRDIIRANERYRSVSRTLFQLGAGLIAAAVVRVYDDGRITAETAGWLAGSAVLIWMGWLMLSLLDSEDV